jgi:hypothetical protein
LKRAQLEHVLRAASRIVGEPDVLVLGSQSVLGSIPEDCLPDAAVASIEVDVAFLDDPEEAKADLVDAAIGELSRFHETHGYYAQGIAVDAAVLPAGWERRLVLLENARTAPARGLCLDPHDCVVAKLVAGRPKDLAFAEALIAESLVAVSALAATSKALTGVAPATLQRIRSFLERVS